VDLDTVISAQAARASHPAPGFAKHRPIGLKKGKGNQESLMDHRTVGDPGIAVGAGEGNRAWTRSAKLRATYCTAKKP
jgi:hypothetical protein